MRLRTLICSLALTSLSAPALAEPTPSDASFEDARVVGVLPVLTTGSRTLAYQRLGALIAQGHHHNGVLTPTTFVALTPGQGFGFAGASTETDVAILRLAFLVGSAPSVSDDAAELASIVATYDAAREVLAPLAPELVAATDAFIAAARSGRIDSTALATAMRRAEEGIAKGPARGHGYFATGLWLGLSMLTVGFPETDETFVAMASPLATMLEQDAEFGGSDLTLAAELRKIAGLLAQGRVDLTTYKASLGAAFSIEADRR